MRSAIATVLLLTACVSQPPDADDSHRDGSVAPARRIDYDILIRGGEVIDGSGKQRVRADVAIRGDSIAAIGNLANATAVTVVDASGKIVAPGLIDLLGNSESSVLIDPLLEGKIRQGVTTEVTGEGHSPGPVSDAMAEQANRDNPPTAPRVDWRSLDDFMKRVERQGTALNFAFYVGATNAREMVVSQASRKPTEEELQRMAGIVDQAMREGAVGLSTALIYPPASYATTEELIALARASAARGGAYFTHLRNESDRINAALDEAFRIGREAKIPVNIFHLKIGGRSNWGKMPQIVTKIETQRRGGLDVAANVYPYTGSATALTTLVPAWALEGGYTRFRQRILSPAVRQKVIDEIHESRFLARVNGPAGVLISKVPNPAIAARYERKRLNALARELKKPAAEVVVDLFAHTKTPPTAIFFSMNEDDLRHALKQPWVSLGSDSGAVVGEYKQKGAHPRAYGTFSRVLGHYVRDVKLFSLEEAVRKVTSQAAARAGLRDRGLLRKGLKADVVVFDAATIADRSTYEDPHQYSVGISHVIVNGQVVLQDGAMTGKLPGRVLRKRLDERRRR